MMVNLMEMNLMLMVIGDDGDELTNNPLDVVAEVLGSVPAVALVRILLCHLLVLVRGALFCTSAQVEGLDATEALFCSLSSS